MFHILTNIATVEKEIYKVQLFYIPKIISLTLWEYPIIYQHDFKSCAYAFDSLVIQSTYFLRNTTILRMCYQIYVTYE